MARLRFPAQFKATMLQSPRPLGQQAGEAVANVLQELLNMPARKFWALARKYKRYLRENLHVHLRAKLLSKFMPHYDGPMDDPSVVWSHPCYLSAHRIRCQIHPECVQMWTKAARILELLFDWDADSLKISLRKVSVEKHRDVMNAILDVIQQPSSPLGSPCLLKELVMSGGSIHTDALVVTMESLAFDLAAGAPRVKVLRIPVASDIVLKYLAGHPTLERLYSDRSVRLSHVGLQHLSAEHAGAGENLKALKVEVLPGKDVRKHDVARFLEKMRGLTYLSLGEKGRRLFSNGIHIDDICRQVFVYSALKLSRVHGDFETALESAAVIDRRLTPKYLLQTAPRVTSLYLDWQEELADVPFRIFHPDWFTTLLSSPDWQVLGRQLTELDVISPAVYAPRSMAFSASGSDVGAILRTCPSLERLKVVAGGFRGAPLHMADIAVQGRSLKTLHLELCEVSFFLPLSFKRNPGSSVLSFVYIGARLPAGIATAVAVMMPNLKDLEIQPNAASAAGRFNGFGETDFHQLSQLKRLQRLSLPLAFHSFVNNMPSMICCLRNFQTLRCLVVSWGSSAENYSFSHSRVIYMTRWLRNALKAENADVTVELCYHIHAHLYTRGSR